MYLCTVAFAMSFFLLVVAGRPQLQPQPQQQQAELRKTTMPGLVLLMQFKEIVNDCRALTGASESDFEDLVQKNDVKATANDSMTAKCLRACLMKQFHLMTPDGKFNRDVALQIASLYVNNHDVDRMRVITDIVNNCYNMKVSDNHCEAAEAYGKCASNHVVAVRSLNLQEPSYFDILEELIEK